MPESWFERGKEGGSTTLEKVRARDVGLRTLGLFLYNFNLIPKWRVLSLALILISVPKLHHFGINLKKNIYIYIYIYISKLQHFNLNPKIITQLSLSHQSPNLSLSHKRLLLASLFLSPHSLPLLLLLATTVLPLEATILGVPLFPLSHLLFLGSFIEDFEFYAPPYNAFIEVCLCTVLIYLLWIQFSFFFF